MERQTRVGKGESRGFMAETLGQGDGGEQESADPEAKSSRLVEQS